MTLKNNRAPLLSIMKLYASFHHYMWIQTRVTVRKRLSWVLNNVTLTFDLWPCHFAWTSLLSLVITPENFMMTRWWEHGEKGVTDRRTDWTSHILAWSQLKQDRRWNADKPSAALDPYIPTWLTTSPANYSPANFWKTSFFFFWNIWKEIVKSGAISGWTDEDHKFEVSLFISSLSLSLYIYIYRVIA